MSNTTYHKLTGVCQWAKLTEENKDLKNEKYSIDLFLDGPSLKAFNKLKLRNKIKMNDEGQPYVSFTRKFAKMIKGELTSFGPPALYDEKGDIIENDKPLIGNGSTVTVKFSVYETEFEKQKINGHRLEAVKIEKLIKYEPKVMGVDGVVPF